MSQGRSTPCIGPLMTGILIVGPYKPLRNWFDEFIPYYIYMEIMGVLDPSTYDYPAKYIEILPQRGEILLCNVGNSQDFRSIKSSTTVDDFLSKGRFQNLNLRSNPRDPITLSEDDWGVQSPPQQGI